MMVSVADQALAGAPTPEPYDFRRPVAIPRDAVRGLDAAVATFASRWTETLSERFGTEVYVAVAPVAVLDYLTVVDRLAEDDILLVCTLGGTPERAAVRLSVPTTLGWVRRLLGGSLAPVEGRSTLTRIEEAFARDLVDSAMADLRIALASVVALDVVVGQIAESPRMSPLAAPDAPMISLAVDVAAGGHRGSLALVFPAAALVAKDAAEAAPAPSAAAPADLLRAQLVDVPVQLSLRMRPASVTPGTVLALAVGDVLPMPHPLTRPLDLAVEGEFVAHAAIGTQGAALACVVVDLEETA